VKKILSELFQSAKKQETETKKYFDRIKKKHPKNIDLIVKELHEHVFQEIDCLDCANCCKSISPIITDKDIERISKHLKIKPSLFIEKYLHLDKENDYVFNDTPCPFLMTDNYCSIYENRPKACKEYPHTNSPNFIKRLNLTLKNAYYCPAVFKIIEKMKKEIIPIVNLK